MIDSHVHLNRQEFTGDAETVFDRARAAGVSLFLNVGYDLQTSRESIALAEARDDVLATVGIHPHDAAMLADETGRITATGHDQLAQLEELSGHPKVVAIGEIGLDYFRDLSPRPAQHAALDAQLDLADRVGLPVVFHVRDAWTDTLARIDSHGVPARRGVLHSFSGDAVAVEWARERGFLLGIGGPVTYKGSRLPTLVVQAGIGMLLLETDAPWLPPVPHRGKRNEPGYLPHTLARVASELQIEPAEVERVTSASFRRMFGLPEAGA